MISRSYLNQYFSTMRKAAIALLLLISTCLIYSCEKDKETDKRIPPVTYPNFSKFNVGSYWVYQQFRVDSMGNATPTNDFDSCYVEKDTLINGFSYVKTYRPTQFWPNIPYTIVRDSLHYIVTTGGKVVFSSQDFQTVFYSYYSVLDNGDTMYHATNTMEDKDLSVTTPAGTFITSNFRRTVTYYPPFDYNGKHRYMHMRYAENIGIVIESLPFFSADPNYTERRLVRYHIN